MSSSSLRAELERLRQTISDLERLGSWLDSARVRVRAKAERFSAAKVGDAWSGKAAREFAAELKRTSSKVQDAADHATKAKGVVEREILLTRARIVATELQLAAAVAFEAAQALAERAGEQ